MKDLVEITLDFETYYSKKEKYSLAAKGMTIEKYIRNPKFEIIGLAVKVGNKPTEWLAPHEIEDWIKHIEIAYGWDNVRAIAHNARFDAAILGWKYNIYPKQIADTMLMSRACQLWDGHSLDNVTKELRSRYNWGIVRDDNGHTMWGKFEMKDLPDTLNKGDEVVNADGKQLFDFTEAEYDAYADYCITDVDLTWSAYNWFMKERKFPVKEIDVMTLTIEMFTFPVIELHIPVLQEVEKVINEKRQALLDKVGVTTEDLRSDAKFAMLLSELGVDPPTKLNPKGETKYAFAKKDLGFLKLLEHDDPAVVELVEARLGNKSSQAVTRVKSLLEMSDRGLLPIPLEYYAAHTGRWGGCLAADTLVLVKDKKAKYIVWKPIVTVSPEDLVFDGDTFVSHSGVQYRGYSKVVNYNGIIGTPDHLVLCNNGGYYSISKLRNTDKDDTGGVAYLPEFNGEDGYTYHGNLFGFSECYSSMEAVYDIVNCGPNHRFAVLTKYGIAIVHNSDGINLQNFNRNQLVDKDTPAGTKVFYADKADAVVKVLDDGKVQLARAGVVENDEELLHVMGLRDALKAPKGKKLVVFDLAQVELRANSWMWGEEWVLDTLVQGKDIYKVTAANTYGIPYEEVNKSQRFVGKSQQLGLGYGAGINGLKVVMGKRSEEFTDDELQSFVNAYRSAASNIVRGWKQCKSALGAMVSGVTISFCKDNILSTDGHRIALPNGLHLTYRDIHVRPGEMGPELWFWGKNKQTKKPDWEKTFSGKCDENCCQSLCRIIMGDIMIAIREDFAKRNWSRDDAHICLTVHDEVIVCCKDELAEEVSEIMQYQMKKSRGWYHDLPLDCAGDIAQRYGCAK